MTTPPEPAGRGSNSRSASWLVLVYRVPSEPSRLRAAVWRRLKALGAVYLQSAVVALPSNAENERALRILRNEVVEKMGGTAYLLSAVGLVGGSDLVELFNGARDDEYEEILDKCRDFHSELEKEYAAQHLTYAELEENEEDLTKLHRWFAKVRARDALGARTAEAVASALAGCDAALHDFAARVYEAEQLER